MLKNAHGAFLAYSVCYCSQILNLYYKKDSGDAGD
jgi:hypothetical protein